MNTVNFYNSLSVEVLEEFADNTFGINPPSDLQEFLKYLKPEHKILEVGCGTGRIGIPLILKGFVYTGIETKKIFRCF